MNIDKILSLLPPKVRPVVDPYLEAAEVLTATKNPKVLASLGPSGVRGLVLKRGKQGTPTKMPANHEAFFDWTYPQDHPEMQDLYVRAKEAQWNGADLPWHIDVDPLNPEKPILPARFVNFPMLESFGVHLNPKEKLMLQHSMLCWMLSQFLHGEQGALFAAAQVTEAVQFFDGKLYGATQVMDEARHVEVFHGYLDGKLDKVYQINDNLFTIIDALMTDGRWDMKFLGMQIMVEGLALGAFGTLYKVTGEPLLRELLRNVIMDEARHVHYGVLALREQFTKVISPAERQEREDWAFEVAVLMRNRFLAYEVYDEWFEGIISRAQWRKVVDTSEGLSEFRHVMFNRLVPNLREIGLLTDRIKPHYDQVGLLKYMDGAAAPELSGEQLIADLDALEVPVAAE